jgi:hypothetical protein
VKDFPPDVEVQTPEPATEPEPAETDASPTDEPFYPLQWDRQVRDIPTVHETTQGEGTRVAVLDTGIPEHHPDFQESLNAGLSRDLTGTGTREPLRGRFHGTHVSGVIAAGNDSANLRKDGGVISLPDEAAQGLSVVATTSVGFLSGDQQNAGFEPASYTNYGINVVTVATPGGDTPDGSGVPDLVYSAIPQATADSSFLFAKSASPYA